MPLFVAIRDVCRRLMACCAAVSVLLYVGAGAARPGAPAFASLNLDKPSLRPVFGIIHPAWWRRLRCRGGAMPSVASGVVTDAFCLG